MDTKKSEKESDSMEDIFSSIRSMMSSRDPLPEGEKSGEDVLVLTDIVQGDTPKDSGSPLGGNARSTAAPVRHHPKRRDTSISPASEQLQGEEHRECDLFEGSGDFLALIKKNTENLKPPLSDNSSLSSEAQAAAFASLDRLRNATERQKEEGEKSPAGFSPQASCSLEALVREAITPILKAWLDANLPRIIEDAVDHEIATLSRHLRGK